jgi:photosystem II stability/assembly factor-like uncharacterized protein
VNQNVRHAAALAVQLVFLALAVSSCTGSPPGDPAPTGPQQPAPSPAPAPAGGTSGAIPADAAYDFVAVDFVDARRGWIVGADEDNNAGAVFRTTDAGATWTKTSDFDQDILRDVDFVDASNGWVVGDTAIYRTTDGGVTWKVDAEHLVWSVEHEMKHVTATTNTGTVMTAGEVVTAIFFIDATTGWAAADAPASSTDLSQRRGVVYATTDGGATWRDVSGSSLSSPINDIWFVTSKEGWAVGGNAEVNEVDLILHTTDGGRTWTRQRSGAPQLVRAIHFVDGKRGWAVGMTVDLDSGEHGISRVLATTDGGKSWSQQFASPRSFFDVYFSDPLHGWAVGDRSAVYATADGGATWVSQTRFTTENAVRVAAAGKTMAANGRPRTYSEIAFLDISNGWAGGDGMILKRK